LKHHGNHLKSQVKQTGDIIPKRQGVECGQYVCCVISGDTFCSIPPPLFPCSKASPNSPVTRVEARRVKNPNHGLRSSSITSTSRPTRSRNPMKPQWTVHMPGYFNNSSSSCSSRSSANSNSITITRPYYQHHLSMCHISSKVSNI